MVLTKSIVPEKNPGMCDGFLGGVVTPDHFNHWLQRHGIHEMHPKHSGWALRRRGNSGDRDGRSIGGKNRTAPHKGINLVSASTLSAERCVN
jgi:hypothetical protein